jgi:transposase
MIVEVIKQNVGIDVSKDTIDVAFSNLTADFRTVIVSTRKFSNTAKGFKQLQEWANGKRQPGGTVHFTMEATGVYYESLSYFLYEQEGYRVHVVLPNRVYKYIQSLGLKSKTDKIDACVLAQMGLEREMRQWQPVSPSLLGLKQLTRERDALVRNKTNVSNQLHAYSHQGKPNKETIARSKKLISFLDRQIKQIEKDIKSFVDRDKELKTKMEYLLSIPGVGMVSATVIVAETNGFAAIESIKQLTSYAGLDVRISESGKWKGKSTISKRGNSHIRKAVYMPSLSKIRKDKETKQFYERLKDKKGVGMIALIAVGRKLLGLMYTLWKKEEMFMDVSKR